MTEDVTYQTRDRPSHISKPPEETESWKLSRVAEYSGWTSTRLEKWLKTRLERNEFKTKEITEWNIIVKIYVKIEIRYRNIVTLLTSFV